MEQPIRRGAGFIKRYLFLIALMLVGCRQETPDQMPAVANLKPSAFSVQFTNITQKAGIHFMHNNGGFGKKYLPESLGSGCAFLDYDNDGRQDILLINSKDWPGQYRKPSFPSLYRNKGDGNFVDVTHEAGLAVEMYGLGAAIADYDNDGNDDIYITCLESDHLFHNNGHGSFTDVTRQSRITDSEFGTSATWLDYDKDGKLDLYVCNYVKWSPEKDLYCTLDGVNKSYCTPESYEGASPGFYHNRGDGTFEDVTKSAGLQDPTSKALGVVAFDYDQDGWPDLFVANDTQPNKLYHNNQNGTFTDKGVVAGVAFSETGVARAGMGVDAADYDSSGYPSLLIGNFSNEMLGLYHNEGTGLFIDEAPATTVGQASLLTLTFGAFFFDFDLDGHTDIFTANGHVHDDINRVQQQITYAEPPHLFRNLGLKKFEEVTRQAGSDLSHPVVARGAAFADIDNDGDLDVLLSTNGGPVSLFRNDGLHKNHFLTLKMIGSKSNRDGIGTKVVIQLNDGSKQWQAVKGSSSYCSQSQLPLTFGLGSHQTVKLVEIYWPSGTVQKLNDVKADQFLTIHELDGARASSPQSKS